MGKLIVRPPNFRPSQGSPPRRDVLSTGFRVSWYRSNAGVLDGLKSGGQTKFPKVYIFSYVEYDLERFGAKTNRGQFNYGPMHLIYGPMHLIYGPMHLIYGPMHLIYGPMHLIYGPMHLIN